MTSVYRQFQKIEGRPQRERRPSAALDVCQVAPAPVCRCGKCRQCVEEARWERIFTEKFADPEYYGQRPVAQGSSLGWLK